MIPERWKAVETIVAAALELSGEDQESYLAAACADDHELRAEVEDLLTGRSGAAGFLEAAVGGSSGEPGSRWGAGRGSTSRIRDRFVSP